MKRIATKWTEHLADPEKRKDFEKLLRNSTITLSRLREIVRGLIQEQLRVERRSDVYDSPNWSHKQADTNGMLRAYNNIDLLLSFMDKE